MKKILIQTIIFFVLGTLFLNTFAYRIIYEKRLNIYNQGWDGPGKNSSTLTLNYYIDVDSFPNLENSTYNPDGFTREEFENDIIEALTAWENIIDIDFVRIYTPDQPTSLDFTYMDLTHLPDGLAAFGYPPPYPGLSEQDAHRYFPGEILPNLSGDIFFNIEYANLKWTKEPIPTHTTLDPHINHFKSVAKHEIGHALGLGHSSELAAMMSYSIYRGMSDINFHDGSYIRDVLSNDDICAARHLYGFRPDQAISGVYCDIWGAGNEFEGLLTFAPDVDDAGIAYVFEDRVGIGTAPSYQFHVKGDSNFFMSNILFNYANVSLPNDNGDLTFTQSNSKLFWEEGIPTNEGEFIVRGNESEIVRSDNKFVITYDGKVRILSNISPDDTDEPIYAIGTDIFKLEIEQDMYSKDTLKIKNEEYDEAYSAILDNQGNNIFTSYPYKGRGYTIFQSYDPILETNHNYAFIEPDGNMGIGIGITSLTEKLKVGGDIKYNGEIVIGKDDVDQGTFFKLSEIPLFEMKNNGIEIWNISHGNLEVEQQLLVNTNQDVTGVGMNVNGNIAIGYRGGVRIGYDTNSQIRNIYKLDNSQYGIAINGSNPNESIIMKENYKCFGTCI